ncbi:MAG: hypothetical protein PHN37_02465 [Candidatus Pacebacteria bacterium]|nr:hypothetical protein [Candidatus Paceibacterota bacterium]
MKTWLFLEKGFFGPDRVRRAYSENQYGFPVLSLSVGDKVFFSRGREGVIFHIFSSETPIGVTLHVYIRGKGIVKIPL